MSPIAATLTFSTSPANAFYALSRRAEIQSTLDNFKSSFSSWDSCMSKAYCKWPVVAAIIIASLIVLSLLVSLARCLCCGLECCFACCACCNACCPAPRGGSRKDSGGTYKQQQQWPQQQQQPYAYQQPMMYGPPGGAGGIATFDAPSKNTGRVHEDTLPMMPTWETSNTRRVEHPEDEEDAHLDHEDAGTTVSGQQSFAMGPVSPTTGLPPSPQRLISYGGDEARQSLLAPQPQRPVQQSALQSPVQSPTYGYEDTSYTSPSHIYNATSELDSAPTSQGYAANPYQDNSYSNYNNRPAPASYTSPAPSYHTSRPMANSQQYGGYTSPPPPQQAQNTGYYGANPYASAPAPYQQHGSQDVGTAYASPAQQRMPSGGYNNSQYGGNTYREV